MCRLLNSLPFDSEWLIGVNLFTNPWGGDDQSYCIYNETLLYSPGQEEGYIPAAMPARAAKVIILICMLKERKNSSVRLC